MAASNCRSATMAAMHDGRPAAMAAGDRDASPAPGADLRRCKLKSWFRPAIDWRNR